MNGKLQSIVEIADKIKRFSRDNSDKIYHIFELCLIAAIFFGIGVLFAQTAQTKGEYVASKNGKTYYKITCSNRIKEENKIYFQSESDAQKSGFTPSKTCFK